jgi:hypothetical protein
MTTMKHCDWLLFNSLIAFDFVDAPTERTPSTEGRLIPFYSVLLLESTSVFKIRICGVLTAYTIFIRKFY